MKNTYITIIVLIVLVGAAVFFIGTNKKAIAPGEVPIGGGNQVACTMEARLCPDGSYVGRSGPKCEFAACPAPKVNTNAAPKEFNVTGKNFSFTPNLLSVKKGDRVKITFKNRDGFHDFRIDEFNVATKTIQGGTQETVEFTANKSGSFQYYCSVGTHRQMGMWGTLKVE